MNFALTSMVANTPNTVTLQSHLKFPNSVFPLGDFKGMLVLVINSVTITIFPSQPKTEIMTVTMAQTVLLVILVDGGTKSAFMQILMAFTG